MNDGLSNENTRKDAGNERGPRRRRSWYRRRQRRRRALLAVAVGTLLAAVVWQNAARYLSLPALRSAQVLSSPFWARTKLQNGVALADVQTVKPTKYRARISGVYPYSVVPGGLRNVSDLRAAMARDRAIRRHFAHFDLEHARILRNSEARAVYLSYRIRDTVFWTRKKIRLHVGELLLSDGQITARARCGNQISDVAQPEVSEQEPDEDVLDKPALALAATPSSPIHPVLAPPELPAGQPIPPQLFAGTFSFPYVPINAPVPSAACPAGQQVVNGHCHKKPKPPVIPEPSTMVLSLSGVALITWRYRRVMRPSAA